MKVIPEMHFGCLTTRWSWKNHSCRKVWKCTCKCGGYCYVKEDALIDGFVKHCGGPEPIEFERIWKQIQKESDIDRKSVV